MTDDVDARHPMQGFSPEFPTPEAYILDITEEIWERRGIATLHRYYAEDIVVRAPAGVVVGNRDVIGATMATLAEFPDRQLPGEDVIWCADGPEAFLSSHRLISTATHLGDGAYGAATGRPLRYRIIADCWCKGDVIAEEWIIRDQGAILRQMGVDPKAYGAQRLAAGGQPLTPATDRPSRYVGRGNTHPAGARYADLLTRIMAADLAAIPAEVDRAAHLELPGGVQAVGRDGADRFWMGLRAAFPNATFEIHHAIGREDPGLPPRAALRWSLWGKHDGWGAFGPPSGAEVYVMGLSHAEWGPRGLRRDWTLFDESAIWTQIVAATG